MFHPGLATVGKQNIPRRWTFDDQRRRPVVGVAAGCGPTNCSNLIVVVVGRFLLPLFVAAAAPDAAPPAAVGFDVQFGVAGVVVVRRRSSGRALGVVVVATTTILLIIGIVVVVCQLFQMVPHFHPFQMTLRLEVVRRHGQWQVMDWNTE